MSPSLDLHTRLPRGLAVALAVAALVACGGGDDDAAAVAAVLTCETRQFAAGTTATVPTAAQLTTFAKTYTKGANTVVLGGSGALTVNGKAVTVTSTCLVAEPAGDMLMLSWGTANAVGAGAIVYDSHIDVRGGGISGIADGTVL